MEKNDLIESCRFLTVMDEVSDTVLEKKLSIFLKCLHAFLIEKEIASSRDILSNFLVKPELFTNIPDVMQCIVTCYFIGHNESYVESMGSKLKIHNRSNRNISLPHLEEEIIIAWNGPPIQHSDHLITETINHMHGVGEWHFCRESLRNC